MSLLEWIWDGIVGLVRGLIDAASSTLRGWVTGVISGVNAGLAGLRASWDVFWTKTLPDLWAAIRNAGATILQSITNVYNNVVQYVTNWNTNTTQVYNQYTQVTNQYNANILGATREWVMEILGPAILNELERIPAKTLGPVFNYLIDAWSRGGAESFWRGFEAGQKEEEG